MTDLLDITPGRIIVRRPDGATVLDSASRMPAKLGSVSITGHTLDWPVTDGEYNEWLPLNGLWRHRMFETQRNTQSVLAAYPSSVPPQLWWARLRLTQSVTGVVGGIALAPRIQRGRWVPWTGSVMVESFGTYLLRHMNLAVVGGSLVVECRQSTLFKVTDFDQQSSTRSVISLDAEIAWGIFDA